MNGPSARVPHFAIATLLVLMSPRVTLAGAGEWTTSGPAGLSSSFQLLVHPVDSDTIYLSSPTGLYKSVNGGTSWRLMIAKPVAAAGVDPISTNRVFIAVQEGFYASSDGGEIWTFAGPPIDYGFYTLTHVQALVVEAGSHRIYAVVSHRSMTGLQSQGSILRSADGGASWTSLLDSVVSMTGLVIHPTDPSQLFAFPYAQGVEKSIDDGKTWTAVLTLPWVNGFATSPTDPVVLYVALGGSGIFKSVDSGETWVEADAGIPDPLFRVCTGLTLNPSKPTKVLASCSDAATFQTDDGGAAWQAVDLAGTAPVAYDPFDSNVLYGRFRSDLRRSEDGGRTWRSINTGLGAVNVTALATSALGLGPVYAGSNGEVYASGDQGRSWLAGRSGLPNAAIMDLTVGTASPLRIYAATHGYGLFRSDDGGSTWTKIDSPGMQGYITSVAVVPLNPRIVYAATGNGLFRSEDAGSSWRALSGIAPTVGQLVVDPRSTDTVYLAEHGVQKSTDGGVTWANLPVPGAAYAFSLAVDPSNSSLLYAAESNSLLKSSDGGLTWVPSGVDLAGNITSIVIDPVRPERLYAATDQGVFRSLDRSASWQLMTVGLSTTAQKLAIDPTGRFLYAATDRGVFQLEVTPDAVRARSGRSRPPARVLAPRS